VKRFTEVYSRLLRYTGFSPSSCEPTNLTALPDTNEGDSPANKPGVEVCLGKEEEQQMMAEDTVSCLYAAVECWVEMWEVGRGEVSVCFI